MWNSYTTLWYTLYLKMNVNGINDGAADLKLQLKQNESLDYLQFKVYGNIMRCMRKDSATVWIEGFIGKLCEGLQDDY